MTATIKAVTVQKPGGLDKLTPTTLPDPGAPSRGEIRVRLHATSLNYHDYAVAIGALPTPDGHIPMADGAGVVEAVGEGVTDFTEGDHVVSLFFPHWHDGPPQFGDFSTVPGDGVDGYAREAVVLPSHYFTKAPAGWSHAEAATITTAGLTAWRCLLEGGLKAGDDVLVLGTGGVSIYALQIAQAFGARVFATSSSDEKLARVRKLGAAGIVNYKTDPAWGETVAKLTGGRGVDIVIEVGGPATLGQSIAAGRVGATLSLVGVLTGRAGEVPTGALMRKNQRLIGITVGSRAQQIDMVRAMEVTGIRPVIDSTFALANLADAFRHEEAGAHFGKIAVTI